MGRPRGRPKEKANNTTETKKKYPTQNGNKSDMVMGNLETHVMENGSRPRGQPKNKAIENSFIKVTLYFVSPENVSECKRLTEEFRLLPENHRAKEDKLEVKKMTLHAINEFVHRLEKL